MTDSPSNAPSGLSATTVTPPNRSRGTLLAGVALTVSVISMLTAGYAVQRLAAFAKTAEDRANELEWQADVRSTSSSFDTIDLNVGTIQFLQRGYTIELESVNYGPAGVEIQGHVGNPTNLSLSSVTLNFTVYKPLYAKHDEYIAQLRERQQKPGTFVWLLPDEIGRAQAPTILTLAPKGREHFTVTVPNVTQTKEGVMVALSFSGERYQLLPF